jgi:hypothetical protein
MKIYHVTKLEWDENDLMEIPNKLIEKMFPELEEATDGKILTLTVDDLEYAEKVYAESGKLMNPHTPTLLKRMREEIRAGKGLAEYICYE